MENIMYKIISETIIQRLSDEAFIPVDPANPDYQEYLNPTPKVAPVELDETKTK